MAFFIGANASDNMRCKFLKSCTLVAFGFLSVLIEESLQGLNSGFPTCKVNEPEFQACLDKAIEGGIKFLKKGLPGYNLAALEPFTLPSLQIGAGEGAVHLVQNYKDVMIHGFTDVIVNNSHVDLEKKTLSFSTFHPRLSQNSEYDINGKILVLPVRGKGPSFLTLENLFSNHVLQFDETQKDGKTYWVPKDYSLKMYPNHATYKFDNLFDGNKLLGDNINELINKEWMTIFEDVGQGYAAAYAKIFLSYAKKIFGKAPINEIFMK
ncbi:protein takeout-like [Anthonomus grandis grandis]|uniref:protein takeout-like n=1 Tax=Anthonomus grandis grandis TaxID=2921223 RepID=UPI002165543B|nr:protein takeout-like [Anthonomus grandis grandis]